MPAAATHNPDVTTQGATLWLREVEEDNSGTSGIDIPCTDLVGTSAAPLAIPANSGLRGYSREFVTAADWLVGTLAIATSVGTPGVWMLQTRYQPQSVSFTPEEWRRIIVNANPTCPVPGLAI